MPRISVITPTIRLAGLRLVEKSLMSQSFEDYEWLICSKERPSLVMHRSKWRWLEDDFKGGYWTLNRAYNKLFKEAKGELIVSWQDFIYAKPDALKKFWVQYEITGKKGIVSGVGDQYATINKYERPEGKIWSDPRKTSEYGTFYECNWNDNEWNFASFPKAFIEEIGGMDEGLDSLGYGGDQLQVCERWNDLGHKFYLDQTNESFTLRHDRSNFGGEAKWNEKHVLFNGKYEMRKKHLKDNGSWLKLNYL